MSSGEPPPDPASSGRRKKKRGAARAGHARLDPETLAARRRLVRSMPLLRAVDHHYVQRLFGEPAGSLLFDAGEGADASFGPSVLEVPFWTPREGSAGRALTRLATLGMSAVPLTDGSRLELQIASASPLDEEGRQLLAIFLASLVGYPFFHDTALAHGDFLTSIGEVPGFPGMAGIVLERPGDEPWEQRLEAPDTPRVDFLLAVPVLPSEVELLRAYGIDGLRAHWTALGLDRFDPARPAL